MFEIQATTMIYICMIFSSVDAEIWSVCNAAQYFNVCVYYVHKRIPSAAEGGELVTPVNP